MLKPSRRVYRLGGPSFSLMMVRTSGRPKGLNLRIAVPSSVYHVAHRSFGQTTTGVTQSTELVSFTQALYEARELAMERMQAEAISMGAEGIVGVQLIEKSHFWGSHVIEFFAIGTAVRPIRSDHQITQPQMVLTLDA